MGGVPIYFVVCVFRCGDAGSSAPARACRIGRSAVGVRRQSTHAAKQATCIIISSGLALYRPLAVPAFFLVHRKGSFSTSLATQSCQVTPVAWVVLTAPPYIFLLFRSLC